MKKEKINRRLASCCLLVVAIMIGFAGYKSYRYQIIRAQRAVSQENLTALQKEIETIQTRLSHYEQEQKDFQRYLFKEEDVPAFLEGVSRFAGKSAVNILDMKTKKFSAVEIPKEAKDKNKASGSSLKTSPSSGSPDRQEKTPTLAAMPIQFQISGAFQDLVRFLNYLEDFQQLLTIADIEITYAKTYPILTCRFTLKIYSFKYVEELGS